METKFEDPCDDGKPCEFIWHDEEFCDDYGDTIDSDLYCAKCYRYRDWSKEEYEEII